jgi:hypothetical protein
LNIIYRWSIVNNQVLNISSKTNNGNRVNNFRKEKAISSADSEFFQQVEFSKENHEEKIMVLDDNKSTIESSDVKSNKSLYYCKQILGSGITNIETLWNSHLNDILDASQHPQDEGYEFKYWFSQLLHMLNTSRLSKSVIKTPKMDYLRPIFDVLIKRKEYIDNQDKFNDLHADEIPPRLKILVMGGSVTQGRNCTVIPKGIHISGHIPQYTCSWSQRLEKFLNNIMKFDAVNVYNMAVGATSSSHGALSYNYGLLPPSFRHPHVVINAYSTNDWHFVHGDQGELYNMIQGFIRKVLSPRPLIDDYENFVPPLLILMDDFLGSGFTDDNAFDTMSWGSAMYSLSSYYEIMSVSYADAIRQLVYSDVKEHWFHTSWFTKDGGHKQNVHPFMGGHLGMMWVMAYNLLHSALLFCSEEIGMTKENEFFENLHIKDDYYIEGKPSLDISSDSLIPPLGTFVPLLEISEQWKLVNKDTKAITSGNGNNSKKQNKNPCIYSWIGGGWDNISEDQLAKLVEEATIEETNDWKIGHDGAKVGLVPNNGIGSSITFEFKNLSQRVKLINIFTMKSYGETWYGSKGRISVYVGRSNSKGIDGKKLSGSAKSYELVQTIEVSGYHTDFSSQSYLQAIDLNEKFAHVGDDLQVIVELIDGNTFKITGVAFCNR